MKREKHLYEKIVDYENLWQSYKNAAKGKRFRSDVLAFTKNLEENLIVIQNELLYKTYEIGRYREFYVHDPKKRLVMALPFRDRVVQWAIYRVIEPILNKQFIDDSFACRKGKGVQSAADRLQYWLRRMSRRYDKPYFLKLDISKYFYRIDHDILLSILDKKFDDPNLMWLLRNIICSEHTKFGIPLGDHGFEQERIDGIGIPIGNLTSQLFANLYLNEILHPDKKELNKILEEIHYFLMDSLHLNLNNKTAIRPISNGVEFVGYRIWPTHRKLKKKTVKKMKARLKYIKKAYMKGDVGLDDAKATVASYLGYMKHASCYRLKKKVLWDFVLQRSQKSG